MKKYIISLILFLGYSCDAMELDPFDRSIKYDKKCFRVARYLHKYPRGKNEQQAEAIERFLEDRVSERVTVCPWLVTKYKNMLDTHEAHVYLNNLYAYQEIHKNNPTWNKCTEKEDLGYEIRCFSSDLRKKIFTQALWFVAEEYYVAYNTLEFLAIKKPIIWCPYSSAAIRIFFKPYFLAEINGKDTRMHFTKLGMGLPEDVDIDSTASLWEGDKKLHCESTMTRYRCPIRIIKKLIAFLDKKDERVHSFTTMFDHYIKQLSCVEGKDGADAFIFLLERFKELTKRTVYCYTGRDRLT